MNAKITDEATASEAAPTGHRWLPSEAVVGGALCFLVGSPVIGIVFTGALGKPADLTLTAWVVILFFFFVFAAMLLGGFGLMIYGVVAGILEALGRIHPEVREFPEGPTMSTRDILLGVAGFLLSNAGRNSKSYLSMGKLETTGAYLTEKSNNRPFSAIAVVVAVGLTLLVAVALGAAEVMSLIHHEPQDVASQWVYLLGGGIITIMGVGLLLPAAIWIFRNRRQPQGSKSAPKQ